MPNCTVNYSPFAVRTRPDKRREDVMQKGNAIKSPSVTGQSSTSSTTSSPRLKQLIPCFVKKLYFQLTFFI